MNGAPTTASHDEFEALLSDHVDGSLGADEKRRLEEHLATCAHCQAALAELRETMSALSGLNRVPAPENFDRDVAETIRRRSGGRFFGRRALGDRVPFELLALLALALGVALYFFLRGSDTGSLSPFRDEPEAPAIHEDAPNVVPRP
ncbi:MAG TPA: zf-HC2 domain-containing protein [Kofleriaceae bacterium]|nr:zf-HC2 domain-containing protein [Kofleriaceae bacterium]